jgi:hypothetical protein
MTAYLFHTIKNTVKNQGKYLIYITNVLTLWLCTRNFCRVKLQITGYFFVQSFQKFPSLQSAIPYLSINDAAYAWGDRVSLQELGFLCVCVCEAVNKRRKESHFPEMQVSMGNSSVENRRSKIITLSFTVNLRYISRQCPKSQQK